ncbi:hypothetical protein, partial [Streptomyces sp. 4F14]|uniref:hypothetical protein n=1 Tax=Streptomyces sp. 4F14 TaxID=3394380 RepID=UPI003A880555
FEGDPYLPVDPGQNASARLAMSTVWHEDPQKLKARGLEGHASFLTTDFDLTIATAMSDEVKRND